MDAQIILIVVPALAFAFMNGANDSGTMAASVVGSRAFEPRTAVLVGAVAAFAGAIVFGSAVARTLGEGLIDLERIPAGAAGACIAASLAAILWGSVAWKFGLPGSYTHSLLGGWLGAFVGLGGVGAVRWGNAGLVLAAVLLTPLLGLVAAWAAMRLFYRLASELSIQTKGIFRGLETLAYLAMCLAHGANAAQKSMALLVLAGLSYGRSEALPVVFVLPAWIRVVCAGAFALGVLFGFTRTLKTVGFGIFRLDTVHSFCALSVSGGLIVVSTALGFPLSAGQINSSAVLGTGAGHNPRAVRWQVAGDILANWVLTFPASAAMSCVLAKIVL